MSIRIPLLRGSQVCTVLSLAFLMLQATSASASGSLKGRVLDRATGDPLPGANVLVINTGVGTATDLDGRFTLPTVPAGRQTLRVSYIGYVTVTRDVTVEDNATMEQEFRMVAEALTGEMIVV